MHSRAHWLLLRASQMCCSTFCSPQSCMMVEEGAVPLLVNMMQVGAGVLSWSLPNASACACD